MKPDPVQPGPAQPDSFHPATDEILLGDNLELLPRIADEMPTDVWWHRVVPTSGAEKTGYPTQKPEGIMHRMVQASTREGDWCLDFFAGSGTLGAVAARLGRRYVLIDANPEAVRVMRARLGAP